MIKNAFNSFGAMIADASVENTIAALNIPESNLMRVRVGAVYTLNATLLSYPKADRTIQGVVPQSSAPTFNYTCFDLTGASVAGPLTSVAATATDGTAVALNCTTPGLVKITATFTPFSGKSYTSTNAIWLAILPALVLGDLTNLDIDVSLTGSVGNNVALY